MIQKDFQDLSLMNDEEKTNYILKLQDLLMELGKMEVKNEKEAERKADRDEKKFAERMFVSRASEE